MLPITEDTGDTCTAPAPITQPEFTIAPTGQEFVCDLPNCVAGCTSFFDIGEHFAISHPFHVNVKQITLLKRDRETNTALQTNTRGICPVCKGAVHIVFCGPEVKDKDLRTLLEKHVTEKHPGYQVAVTFPTKHRGMPVPNADGSSLKTVGSANASQPTRPMQETQWYRQSSSGYHQPANQQQSSGSSIWSRSDVAHVQAPALRPDIQLLPPFPLQTLQAMTPPCFLPQPFQQLPGTPMTDCGMELQPAGFEYEHVQGEYTGQQWVHHPFPPPQSMTPGHFPAPQSLPKPNEFEYQHAQSEYSGHQWGHCPLSPPRSVILSHLPTPQSLAETPSPTPQEQPAPVAPTLQLPYPTPKSHMTEPQATESTPEGFEEHIAWSGEMLKPTSTVLGDVGRDFTSSQAPSRGSVQSVHGSQFQPRQLDQFYQPQYPNPPQQVTHLPQYQRPEQLQYMGEPQEPIIAPANDIFNPVGVDYSVFESWAENASEEDIAALEEIARGLMEEIGMGHQELGEWRSS